MSDTEEFEEKEFLTRLTNSLRANGLDSLEARCHDGWWHLVDRRLNRQAVQRYRDPYVLDNLIWTRDARIWPLMVVEV
jgi:hypothetical protein